MKVFISQPMRGLEMEEIKRRRDDALMSIAVELDTAMPQDMNKLEFNMEKGPLWCLGRSIQRMAAAEAVFFLPGWESANGCRIERAAAEYYGVRIYEMERDDAGYRVLGTEQMSFRELENE